MIEVHAIGGVPEVRPGDDVGALIATAAEAQRLTLQARDIVVVTQKIVSKSEGRFVLLGEVEVSVQANELASHTHKDPRLVQVVLNESQAVVRAAPNVLVTRHKRGFVLANAGVDRSNLGPDREEAALLLPENPDASARAIAAFLTGAASAPIGVVISDSFGRPWRLGVVNVAIGAAGLPSLIDRRGERDRDGRPLEVTQVAFADLIAAAAGLAMGEAAESAPAALVRGCVYAGAEQEASALIRPLGDDLFQ